MKMSAKERGKHLVERGAWNLLASRSTWSFGSDENGTILLGDDSLPFKVSKTDTSDSITKSCLQMDKSCLAR